MKKQLICSLSLLAALASASFALVPTPIADLDAPRQSADRPDRSYQLDSRYTACETAVDLLAALPHNQSYQIGPEGAWFHLAPRAEPFGLNVSTCNAGSIVDGDTNIALLTGTCDALTTVWDYDSPHQPCTGGGGDYPTWYASILCEDYVFAANTDYWIVLYDYNGVGGVIQVEADICEITDFECPDNALVYDEALEAGCGDFAHVIDCGITYCGDLPDLVDEDWYTLLVPNLGGSSAGAILTLNVYADDTPGQAAFGYGCDPIIEVYGDDCATLLYMDDDGGTGFDSQLMTGCLAPGFYYVKIYTPYSAGPYLFNMACAPCCGEDNSAANPFVLTTGDNYDQYINPENALAFPVSLCDYCNLSNYSAGGDWCFNNGLCFLPQTAGEFWFNVYQPAIPTAGNCGYVLLLSTEPGFTNTCTPLFGVGQNGALLGWFGVDPGAGLFPSVYNDPLTPGNTTFVVDGSAGCCDGTLTLYAWYEWFDNGCTPVGADEQPAAFALAQNAPNPFNPTTTISFTLPETGAASLKVYDMNGREVATLVNGMTERGSHTVTFDASSLSTGVYFYTLQSGDLSTTKKMVLVK